MPLWSFEVICVALLLGGLVWINTRSLSHHLQTLRRLTFKLVICNLLLVGVGWLAGQSGAPLADTLRVGLLLSVLVWLGVSALQRPSKVIHAAAPTRWRKLGHLGLSSLFLLAWLLLLDVLATVIPGAYLQLPQQHSWLLRPVALLHQPPADEPTLDDVMAQQNLLLIGLGHQARQARQWLYDITGLQQVTTQLGALQEVLALSHAQRTRIIQTNPALQALTEHPRVLRVVNNPQIAQLITAVGEGQVQALWQLQQHPDVIALLNDRELHQQMMRLDLPTLLREHQRTQWADQPLLPVLWYVTTFPHPHALVEALEDPTRWRASPTELRWPESGCLGAAWAQVHAHRGSVIQLQITTPAQVSVFVDQQPIAVSPRDGSQQVEFTSTGAALSVCVLLDFRHTTEPPTAALVVKCRTLP